MRIHSASVAVLALVSSLPFAGCGVSQRQALEFNEAIVGGNLKLEKAGRDLGDAIGTALGGEPADVAEAGRLYDVACQTLRQVKADTRALRVPDSKSARDLYAAYQTFLAGQERLLLRDMDEIMNLIEAAGLDQTERAQGVVAILERIQGAEGEELAVLKSAQQAFAREYNVILQ